jgi:hypothetical protein
MNERIRDLKEQALIWSVETLDPDALNDNEWGVAIDEKFAELIVRECAEIADHSNVTGKSIIGERIKQHFGVELDVNETLRNRSTYFGNDI